MPPSDVTPTIHEVDEEEAESETEGQCQAATPTEPSEELPQVTWSVYYMTRFAECIMYIWRFSTDFPEWLIAAWYIVSHGAMHLTIPSISSVKL